MLSEPIKPISDDVNNVLVGMQQSVSHKYQIGTGNVVTVEYYLIFDKLVESVGKSTIGGS